MFRIGRLGSLALIVGMLCIASGSALAQQKLKWAHVYETSEPYHKWSVWAAAEIEKRTNGKYHIDVFPASSLGKESDINQGLTLGTVDMIISGLSFAARTMPRIGVGYYPYTFRDGDHLITFSKSPSFTEMIDEYRNKTGIQITAMTYYGARHIDVEQGVHRLRRHEGPQDARPRRARVPGAAQVLRRQSDADRVRRGLPRAAERHRRRAGESADDDRGEEILRSAEVHHPDRAHRRLAGHAGRAARLEQALRRRKRRSSPTSRAKPPPARRREIKKREGELADEFKKKGLQRPRGRQEELPGRDPEERQPFESMGFTKADWDKIQALKSSDASQTVDLDRTA